MHKWRTDQTGFKSLSQVQGYQRTLMTEIIYEPYH